MFNNTFPFRCMFVNLYKISSPGLSVFVDAFVNFARRPRHKRNLSKNSEYVKNGIVA